MQRSYSGSSLLSTSWQRENTVSHKSIGVPRNLMPTASHSSLGVQLNSTRETAERAVVPQYDNYRTPCGVQRYDHPGNGGDKTYLGEAHNRHLIPPTPGPGKYRHRQSLNEKQLLSRNRNAPKPSFPRTSRFGYVDKMIRETATPGPGAYVN